MDLISIIIPVYNVEKYLQKCIDSVVNQTYQNLEIILVDDGSTDGSGLLADEIAKSDPRIKVIHQQNKGLSGARNAGIAISKGQYIAFLDSDDTVDKEMYKTMLDELKKEDADFVCCGVDIVNDKGHVRYYNDNLDQHEVCDRKRALYLHAVKENTYISTSACDKLYKKELIMKRLFREDVLYEDLRNIAYYISQSNKVVYYNKPFYKYYYNDNSLTHGAFNPKWYSWVEASNERLEIYQKEAPEYIPYLYATYVDNVLSILYKSRKDKNNIETRNKILLNFKEIIKNKDIPLSKKARYKLKLFKINKHLFYFLMRLYDFIR